MNKNIIDNTAGDPYDRWWQKYDTRWAYFQAPITAKDALGFRFPVPSKYSHDLLEVIIKHRFLKGPGSLEVKAGNFEVFNTKNRTRVTMAILVGSLALMDERLAVVYNALSVMYGLTVPRKKRKMLKDFFSIIESVDNKSTSFGVSEYQGSCPRKRIKIPQENGADVFKNVRVADGSMSDVSRRPIGPNPTPSDTSVSTTENDHFAPLDLDDAFAFLKRVKEEHAGMGPYNGLLDILAGLGRGTINTLGMAGRVVRLFGDK
ncbi:hypothetical protein AOQ84DRAFT_422232 [Glonium stellatum]|uniref:Uncharacterized protein n=1 Tax=Glonium stellatum TaxID=574774 RepID=A0A8E2JMK2_9PEZI|nr:hypothetical protein AOQ84DRAFT_422232 [Glonium stellatum]